MFIALSSTAITVIMVSALRPVLWISGLLAMLVYTLNFNPAIMFFAFSILLVLFAVSFFSALLSSSSDLFFSIKDNLNNLLLVLTLSCLFASSPFVARILEISALQSHVNYGLLLTMLTDLISTVSLIFLILCSLTIIFELAIRVIVTNQVNQQCYEILRTMAFCCLLLLLFNEFLTFFINTFIST